MQKNEFYTFREYMSNEKNNLSACEEDYVEMIYRLCTKNEGFTRVNDLALALNVKPPSVTKMIKKLGTKELTTYKKYGTIELSDYGKKIGSRLLYRHNTIENFLRILNISDNLLEETEKIEHTISPETLKSIKSLVDFFHMNSDILNKYSTFCNEYDSDN